MNAAPTDIEVYVAAPAARVIAWLNQRFSWSTALTAARHGGMATHRGRLLAPARSPADVARDDMPSQYEVPVLIVEEIADAYLSVLFDSAAAPWIDDLACAKEIAIALDCEVRCVDGSWQPEQAEDEGWLSVTRSGARAIRWKP